LTVCAAPPICTALGIYALAPCTNTSVQTIVLLSVVGAVIRTLISRFTAVRFAAVGKLCAALRGG
jgi:hypothetical protein